MFPTSWSVLVVGVLLHVDHPQPFSLLDEGPSVLRGQAAPFLSYNTKYSLVKFITIKDAYSTFGYYVIISDMLIKNTSFNIPPPPNPYKLVSLIVPRLET